MVAEVHLYAAEMGVMSGGWRSRHAPRRGAGGACRRRRPGSTDPARIKLAEQIRWVYVLDRAAGPRY